jgi:hypothetical protein
VLVRLHCCCLSSIRSPSFTSDGGCTCPGDVAKAGGFIPEHLTSCPLSALSSDPRVHNIRYLLISVDIMQAFTFGLLSLVTGVAARISARVRIRFVPWMRIRLRD